MALRWYRWVECDQTLGQVALRMGSDRSDYLYDSVSIGSGLDAIWLPTANEEGLVMSLHGGIKIA